MTEMFQVSILILQLNLHAEQVPGPQARHQALVLGALAVLAGLAV